MKRFIFILLMLVTFAANAVIYNVTQVIDNGTTLQVIANSRTYEMQKSLSSLTLNIDSALFLNEIGGHSFFLVSADVTNPTSTSQGNLFNKIQAMIDAGVSADSSWSSITVDSIYANPALTIDAATQIDMNAGGQNVFLDGSGFNVNTLILGGSDITPPGGAGTTYLDDQGNYSTPAGGGGSSDSSWIKIQVDSINGNAANEPFFTFFSAGASTVNSLRVNNSATGGAPGITSVGTDTDIDLNLFPQGAGVVGLKGSAGALLPSGTTAQRNSTNGVLRYNTTTAKIEGYENGAWKDLSDTGGGGGGGTQAIPFNCSTISPETNTCGKGSFGTSPIWSTLDYDAAAAVETATWQFQAPDFALDTGYLIYTWTRTSGGSGDVVWGGTIQGHGDGESLTAASGASAVISTVGVPSQNFASIDTMTFTSLTINAGELINIDFSRFGTNPSDTYNFDARIVKVMFYYKP